MEQFCRIDEGFLAWDFILKDQNETAFADISRNFSGFGIIFSLVILIL